VCAPPAKYTFVISDTYGDGICCGYGEGSYIVEYKGDKFEGSQFQSEASHTFGSCNLEPTSAPVEPTSAPVEPTSAPVEPTSAPVEPTSAPVEPTSAPVEPSSAPVEPTSAPVEPTTAPVEPTDSPIACNECSNDRTPWMKNNEVECYTYTRIKRKCENNRNWRNNNYCQLSCFLNEVEYEGDNCCVVPTNPPTNAPADTPTNCTNCTDETTPWMRRNDKTCDTFQQLNQKCKNNAVWTDNNYCQLSCYDSGNEYSGDICCNSSNNN